MADKDKKLTVKTITGDVVFFGSYRRDLEESNWHLKRAFKRIASWLK